MDKSLQGKITLVTGATRGIGYWTAHGLAERGAHVILVGHHQGRGEEAQQKLHEAFGPQSATFYKADLSSQEEIHRLSQSLHDEYEQLDVLINNAGGYFLSRQESVDGIEMTFALNHLHYFMISLLLMDLLTVDPPSRIVVVSSEAHRGQSLNFDDLQQEDGYNGMQAYGQSKLANLYFTYELSKRLEGHDLTVNALHPGFVRTHLGKNHWFIRPFLDMIHLLFAKSPQEGAQTSIYLASSSQAAGVTGKYFIDQEAVSSSPASYDREAAQRLWERSAKLTGMNPQEYLPVAPD